MAQISDLQAQLEDALKEKQEVQEKVGASVLLLHTADRDMQRKEDFHCFSLLNMRL